MAIWLVARRFNYSSEQKCGPAWMQIGSNLTTGSWWLAEVTASAVSRSKDNQSIGRRQFGEKGNVEAGSD